MCKIKYLSMIAAAVMRTRPLVCRCPGVVMLSVTSDDKMWCVCDTTSHNITQHHTMSQVAQLAGGLSVSIYQGHTARVTTNIQTSLRITRRWGMVIAHYTHHLPRAKAERGFRQSSTSEVCLNRVKIAQSCRAGWVYEDCNWGKSVPYNVYGWVA